jgi:hypothetical protein
LTHPWEDPGIQSGKPIHSSRGKQVQLVDKTRA